MIWIWWKHKTEVSFFLFLTFQKFVQKRVKLFFQRFSLPDGNPKVKIHEIEQKKKQCYLPSWLSFANKSFFFSPSNFDNWGWEKQTNEKTHVFCEDWSTWNSTIWTMSKFVFSANLPFEALKKGKKRSKTSFENFCFEGWNPWNLTRNGVKKNSYMLTFCSFQTKAFFCTRALAFVGKDRQAKKLTSFSCFFSLLKCVTFSGWFQQDINLD